MRRPLAVLGTLALLLVVALAPGPAATASGRSGGGTAGGSGDPAREREAALRTLGCAPGPVDGRVTPMTRAAVVRFQAANRLPQSGRLTAPTRTALSADDAVACDARPVPRRSGHGRRIVISQGQNWVWLVARDGRAVRQAGMIDNPAELDPGSYVTGSKCGRPARVRHNLSENRTLGLEYFVRFAPCGIGFHRIPTRLQRPYPQIHPDWWLGTDLDTSSGCIRLARPTARAVWEFTSRARTRIVVVA